jgi:PTS system arbutin-like IIC component
MKDKIQRFGGAMFFPALLLPFAGMLLGLTVVLLNQSLFPFAVEGATYTKVVNIFLQTSLVIFANLPVIFVLGIPITLAKKESGRACLTSFITYYTFNYFIGGILKYFGNSFGVEYEAGKLGLTEIGGVLTLDTNLLGAILTASLAVWIHNKYYDKEVPNMFQSFRGTPLVVIILFPITILASIITVIVWPSIQNGIYAMQGFMVNSGVIGVWSFTFLERILIPTGLHHFIYGPVFYGPVAIDGGTVNYWIQNVADFARSNEGSLRTLFPQGGLMLTGMGKVFGCTGAGIAIYLSAKEENKKKVLGLLVPAVVTAILTGITEPIEFTFLFVAPLLFALHALLSATMAATAFMFGISGNFQTGLIDFIFQNWLPLGPNHFGTYAIQLIIGFSFMSIYIFLFKFLIEKFNYQTPGRGDTNIQLKTKKDYKDNKGSLDKSLAKDYLSALGGKENIESVTNCATRLRVNVKNPDLVADNKTFMNIGASGVVRSGTNFQIIIGLRVPQVRGEIQELLVFD